MEHALGMLAAGDQPDTMLSGYPWLEAKDVQACLVYARRLIGHERVDPALGGSPVLRDAGHDVTWAGEWSEDPGDEEILARAHRERRVLVTRDKDFGELVRPAPDRDS